MSEVGADIFLYRGYFISSFSAAGTDDNRVAYFNIGGRFGRTAIHRYSSRFGKILSHGSSFDNPGYF